MKLLGSEVSNLAGSMPGAVWLPPLIVGMAGEIARFGCQVEKHGGAKS